jgi:hypothetical protein
METNPTRLTYHHRLAYWITCARDTSDKPTGHWIRLNTYPYIADLHISDATLALALNHVFSISPNQLKKLQAITPVTPPTTVSPYLPTPTPQTPFATTTSTTPVIPTPSRFSSTPLLPHQWRSTYVKCCQCSKLYRYTTNKTPRRYHHYPHYHPPRSTDVTVLYCRQHQDATPPIPITQPKAPSSKPTHHTPHTRPKPPPTPPVSIQYPEGTVVQCHSCNRLYCYTDELQFTLDPYARKTQVTASVSHCSQHKPSPIPRIHPNYTKIHCQACDTSYRYIIGVNFQHDYTPSDPDTYVHFCAHHEPEDNGIFI